MILVQCDHSVDEPSYGELKKTYRDKIEIHIYPHGGTYSSGCVRINESGYVQNTGSRKVYNLDIKTYTDVSEDNLFIDELIPDKKYEFSVKNFLGCEQQDIKYSILDFDI